MAGISTHVLDITTGRPLVGMQVELYDIATEPPVSQRRRSAAGCCVACSNSSVMRAQRSGVMRCVAESAGLPALQSAGGGRIGSGAARNHDEARSPSSRRRIHVLAASHPRFTVEGEMARASAVSSIERPAK